MYKAGNQARTIWRAGCQRRSRDNNSTSASKSSVTTLLSMVAALHEVDGSYEPLKWIQPFQHPITKTLHNFFDKSQKQFLYDSWHIQEFLWGDPSEWKCDTELSEHRSQRLLQSLGVVNDLAESEVALIQEFNSSLIGDEEQKQYLLQVIEDDRKQFQHHLIKSSVIGAKRQYMSQSE